MLVAVSGCTPFGTFIDETTTTPTVVISVPTTVPQDCSIDVTAALNQLLSTVPDNGTLTFPSNGCYQIDGTLTISGKHGLTIDGNNSTFKAMTDGTELLDPKLIRTRDQFHVVNSSYITIKNALAVGANPYAGLADSAYVSAFEAQHGFEITSSSYVVLDHVQAHDVYGDFVYIGGAGTAVSRNVQVLNSTFARNGRIGISIVNAQDVLIAHNSLDLMRRSVFDLEPYASVWRIERVTIQANSIGRARLNFFSSFGNCAVVDYISVLANTLHNKAMNGEIDNATGCTIRRHDFTFSDNVSDYAFGTPSGMALKFVGVDGIVLTNNVQPLQANRNMHLARLTDSTYARVTGNVLLNASGSVFTNDGSGPLCYSNNQIGNPLRVELSLSPCA